MVKYTIGFGDKHYKYHTTVVYKVCNIHKIRQISAYTRYTLYQNILHKNCFIRNLRLIHVRYIGRARQWLLLSHQNVTELSAHLSLRGSGHSPVKAQSRHRKPS